MSSIRFIWLRLAVGQLNKFCRGSEKRCQRRRYVPKVGMDNRAHEAAGKLLTRDCEEETEGRATSWHWPSLCRML
eukprot:s140_g21.t1